jgi:hypothetical protein
LEAANARISSLEAELEASRKAWDAATAAKTNAEKATKSALAKAKKAEKALSDANKGHLQQEHAVIDRLNKMSTLAGGEYIFSFSLGFFALILADVLIPLSLFPLSRRIYSGVFVVFAVGR